MDNFTTYNDEQFYDEDDVNLGYQQPNPLTPITPSQLSANSSQLSSQLSYIQMQNVSMQQITPLNLIQSQSTPISAGANDSLQMRSVVAMLPRSNPTMTPPPNPNTTPRSTIPPTLPDNYSDLSSTQKLTLMLSLVDTTAKTVENIKKDVDMLHRNQLKIMSKLSIQTTSEERGEEQVEQPDEYVTEVFYSSFTVETFSKLSDREQIVEFLRKVQIVMENSHFKPLLVSFTESLHLF